MEPRQQRAAWAAATVAGVLAAFAPAVVGVRTLSQRDTDRLYAPVRTLVVEELRAGRLPLWNPYEGTGKPLFAEGVHSVLHPISLMGAVLAPTSMDFLILAYLMAAALGAFVFAWTLGASPPASAGAGLAFALSGFSASMTGNLVFLAGLSTLPWLVAAATAAGAGARWSQVATALATACALLSGDAQAAIVGLGLGTLLAADRGGLSGAARALAGMTVGVLLAGVQIAATGALLPLTSRNVDLPYEQKIKWALAPGRLLEWVVPGLFRGPLAEVPRAASSATMDPVFANSVYLGVPLLVAAALGARRGRRIGFLLGGASVVLLWLALGQHLGARQLLDSVPVWSRFRYTEKFMAPFGLCACALGALGVDAFGAERLTSTWRRALAGAVFAGGAVLLALLLAPVSTRALASRLGGDAGPFYRSTLAAGLPHLLAGLGALIAANRLRREPARAVALALLVALAPATAIYYGAHLGSRDMRHLSTPLRPAAYPPAPRIVHADDRFVLKDNLNDLVEAITLTESLFLGPPVNVAYRIDTIEPYGALEPGRITRLIRSLGPDWTRAFRRFGVNHVFLQTRPPPDAYALRAVEGGDVLQRDERLGFELWVVPHRPWAFFARRAVAAAGADEAHGATLHLIARDDGDTVVVEAPEPPKVAPGRVLRIERGTVSVRIEAESADPALLVIQDARWPGWRASIDAQPAEILATDYVVRAVRWPPGRHRLEMTYEPPEIRFGLLLTGLGAVLVVVLALVEIRRRRTTPTP